MTIRVRLDQLRQDQRGVAVTEFAILAPVFCLLLMGLMDVSHQAYVRSVIEGAMQKAGRDSGIEAATAETIDARVRSAVTDVATQATINFERRSYSTFTLVRPERFTDKNNNGIREPGECFDDVNGNRTWDADPGKTGQGGAGDVTLYRATVSYPRLFPLGAMIGWPSTQTIVAETLLKNQPYASQSVPTLVVVCT